MISIGLGMRTTHGLSRHSIAYLLRERFLTDRAAGSMNGLTIPCEPGPGSLTYTDTEGKLSVSGGKLVWGVPAVPTWGNHYAVGDSIARAPGVAVFQTVAITTLGASTMWGLTEDSAPNFDFAVGVELNPAGVIFGKLGPNNVNLDTTLTGAERFCSVARSTGGYLLRWIEALGQWRLLWVDDSITQTPLYPALSVYDTAGTLSDFRVLSLAALDARFGTDDGLCTSVLTNPAENAVATMESDAIVEWTYTRSGGAGTYTTVCVRYVDDNNRWFITDDLGGGAIFLVEFNAGVVSYRASGVMPAGAVRVVCIVEGNTYKIYANNVLILSYTDLGSFLINATLMRAESMTGGALARLASYPRRITMPAGV